MTAKKVEKETLGAITPLAKQIYGSAQSSELGVYNGKCNIITKHIYSLSPPQTALSLLSLHLDCLLIPLCPEPPYVLILFYGILYKL